jgi:hypothetical protein
MHELNVRFSFVNAAVDDVVLLLMFQLVPNSSQMNAVNQMTSIC